jgi:membrane protein
MQSKLSEREGNTPLASASELLASSGDRKEGTAPAAVPPSEQPGHGERSPGIVRTWLNQLRAGAWPTLKYLTETEVHTYAFSVAANAILSFVPFFVLVATITRNVFHSRAMTNVVFQVLESYLPVWNYNDKMFIVRNLRALLEMRLTHGIQIVSLVMLFISSTGVFEPLEVALNKVWGFKENRSYLKNQLISLGLALGSGTLGLVSIALTSRTQQIAKPFFPERVPIALLTRISNEAAWIFTRMIVHFFALLATIAVFFFIYWLLPNGKVKARQVFPAAVVVGILLEVAKYIYMLALPVLDFQAAYGPFYLSVTLIFWAFTAGMLLLGGAHLSAAGRGRDGPGKH